MMRMSVACVLFAVSLCVHALEPSVQSVKIKANRMTAPTKPDSRQRQTFTFLGNVKMTSHTLTLQSDAFTVLRQYDNIILMQAIGNARLHDVVTESLAQALAVPVGTELHAKADSIRYYVTKQSVVLEGNAVVRWQGSVIKGHTIEFDMVRYEVTSVAATDGVPTELILEPIQPTTQASTTDATQQVLPTEPSNQ